MTTMMTTEELERAIVDIIDLRRMDTDAHAIMSRYRDKAWTWESSCRHITIGRARMIVSLLLLLQSEKRI